MNAIKIKSTTLIKKYVKIALNKLFSIFQPENANATISKDISGTILLVSYASIQNILTSKVSHANNVQKVRFFISIPKNAQHAQRKIHSSTDNIALIAR
jgi:hypothetical protein